MKIIPLSAVISVGIFSACLVAAYILLISGVTYSYGYLQGVSWAKDLDIQNTWLSLAEVYWIAKPVTALLASAVVVVLGRITAQRLTFRLAMVSSLIAVVYLVVMRLNWSYPWPDVMAYLVLWIVFSVLHYRKTPSDKS